MVEGAPMSDPTRYTSPLRYAVVWCVSRAGTAAVPAATLARVAGVDEPRARAYGTILVNTGVLVETDAGLRPGPQWDAWMASPVRSAPRQNADPLAVERMDAMRVALRRNVSAARLARGWSMRRLAREAGIHFDFVRRLERRSEPPPACHLVLLAQALGVTVEQLVTLESEFEAG